MCCVYESCLQCQNKKDDDDDDDDGEKKKKKRPIEQANGDQGMRVV